MKTKKARIFAALAALTMGAQARAQAFNWNGADPLVQIRPVLAAAAKSAKAASQGAGGAQNPAFSFRVPVQDGAWTYPQDGSQSLTSVQKQGRVKVRYRWIPKGCPDSGGSVACQKAAISRTFDFPDPGPDYAPRVSKFHDSGDAYLHCRYVEGDGWEDCDRSYGAPSVVVTVWLKRS